jgi:hypothetical protein
MRIVLTVFSALMANVKTQPVQLIMIVFAPQLPRHPNRLAKQNFLRLVQAYQLWQQLVVEF